MSHSALLNSVHRYYAGTIAKYGATPRGVDWNSAASQVTRFEQLLRVCDGAGPCSIGDYGCGYGALADHLAERGKLHPYRGYDICDAMVRAARDRHAERSWASFDTQDRILDRVDFVVASGVFNVKIDTPQAQWEKYVLDSIGRMAQLASRGLAFNALTSYSDQDKMRPDLYYADPCFYFDMCKRLYSRHVSLLHDYGLYEFTIVVRY